MQLLPELNKAAGCTSAGTGEVSSDCCARLVLDVAPRVVRVIRRLMWNHRLSELSVPQFRALALISRSPHATLSCVADHVGTSLPAASRMIGGLVDRKLVTRQECHDDRRQVSLTLTPRGVGAFRASRAATQRQLGRQLKSLSQPERRLVVDAMKVMAEIFGADADPAVRLRASGNAGKNGNKNGKRKVARAADASA
jgi:DNA-binding MarR family transcriptional regulator